MRKTSLIIFIASIILLALRGLKGCPVSFDQFGWCSFSKFGAGMGLLIGVPASISLLILSFWPTKNRLQFWSRLILVSSLILVGAMIITATVILGVDYIPKILLVFVILLYLLDLNVFNVRYQKLIQIVGLISGLIPLLFMILTLALGSF